ncbi:MAG TPA: nitrite/sulfite reductase [bacterium]
MDNIPKTWKEILNDKMPADWAEEIDQFEAQITLNKQGKIEPRIFAETRLRRGAYGQRYDNGHRNDGKQIRELKYPSEGIWKGPDTHWDAPGMQRIKFPWGGTTADQLDTMADLAEEYSDGIGHITTRQDFQLHFIHVEDTPDIMRRLAAVGITTREACGNSTRNVTACPVAGVCRTEAFDVTPYSKAIFKFMLGHPDAQDFGRKFKIAFSGCAHEACGLVNMHDMGFIAKKVTVNGQEKPAFDVYVGGGLGPVPYNAKLLSENCPSAEILPLTQAVARVYGRLGEKKIRGMARIKFLVAKLGIDEFRKLVEEERKILNHDPRWTSLIEESLKKTEKPAQKATSLKASSFPKGFLDWKKTNAYQQPQYGYVTVYLKVPLGDLTSHQLRVLGGMARKYVKDTVRTTVEQNLVFRWVSESDLPAVFEELSAIGLGEAGANTISDITTCPGTDTCKLGISASRGLARELSQEMTAMMEDMPEEVRNLKIKVSGCPNSCGQHHISDIGFYGVSRKAGSYTVPHFQLVLGGQWKNNGGSYGMAVAAVPSKRIPEALERLTNKYVKERHKDETFQSFVARVGKVEIKNMLQDLMVIPSHDAEPGLFSDWGDPREYTIADIGKGECAGEVVSPSEFSMTSAESKAFEAQLKLDQKDLKGAVDLAYESMIFSAEGVVRTRNREYVGTPDQTVSEFKTWFFDTGEFVKHVNNTQFAAFLFKAHDNKLSNPNADEAHRRVEESQLFLEAVHSYLVNAGPTPAPMPGK